MNLLKIAEDITLQLVFICNMFSEYSIIYALLL